MFSMNEQSDNWSCEFSSEMYQIDRCINGLRQFATNYDNGVTTTEMEQAVRELLLNAVEHGNKNDPCKHVRCSVLRIRKDYFSVTVNDNGSGFDYSAIDFSKTSPLDGIRHRGLGMINVVADTINFSKGGASVTITVTLPRQIQIDVVQKGSQHLITPLGNLVASGAELFRGVLASCIEKGPSSILFDLQHVENIDSISLSAFVLLVKKIKETNLSVKLEIVNARKEFEELFWLTRLTDVYTFIRNDI
jgi:anti-anti-sigma factor